QCNGATQLSGSHQVNCTTDANGAVVMTLTVPSSIPATGSLEVNARGGTATNHTWYLYEYLYHFSLSPIAPSASLGANQSVPFNLLVAGPDGTPSQAITVQLLFQSTGSTPGSATANGSPLTSSAHNFVTDSNGQIALVYTAPGSIPTNGVDTIMAQ